MDLDLKETLETHRHELLRDQLANLALFRVGYSGGNHNLPKFRLIVARIAARRLGQPVKRRNGDEILLLLRETALPVAGSPTNVKSLIRQSGMNSEPRLHQGYSMSQLPCDPQKDSSQASPRIEV